MRPFVTFLLSLVSAFFLLLFIILFNQNDLSAPTIIIVWLAIFSFLFWLVYSHHRKMLIILFIFVYVLTMAGYYPQDCGCDYDFLLYPRKYYSFCDINCAQHEMNFTQSSINLLLLKTVY